MSLLAVFGLLLAEDVAIDITINVVSDVAICKGGTLSQGIAWKTCSCKYSSPDRRCEYVAFLRHRRQKEKIKRVLVIHVAQCDG
jgi:hypothetical protein